MKVRELMTSEACTVQAGTPVQDAFELMRSRGFRHLPVVDENGKVEGIVSDRGIRNMVVMYDNDEGLESDDPGFFVMGDHRVRDAMVRDPVCVGPDDDVVEAVRVIRKRHFGALLVTNPDGELCGILSYVDLLSLLERLLKGELAPA